MQDYHHRGLFFSWLLIALATLVLIGLGTFVSSSGYGLAIPEWPLVGGSLIPPQLVAGIWYEFLHRMTAAAVGLATVAAGSWVRSRAPRPEVGRLALTAVVLIVVQILLGGLGVLWEFPLWLESLHALLAPLFFALLIVLCTVYSKDWQEPRGSPVRFDSRALGKTRALVVMVLIQIVLGVGLGASEGSSAYGIVLLLHLLTALGVAVLAVVTPIAVLRQFARGPLAAAGWSLIPLVLLQLVIGFGVLVLVTRADPLAAPQPAYVHSAVAHALLAALLLGTSAYLAMMVRRKNALAGPSPAAR